MLPEIPERSAEAASDSASHIKRSHFLIANDLILATFVFFILYRLVFPLVLYYLGIADYFEDQQFSMGTYYLVYLLSYPIGWVILSFTASKFTETSLKELFYKHPILTLFLIFDTVYRLVMTDLGAGIQLIPNALETILYFGFIDFLWWLLIGWLVSKIRKRQRFQWRIYRKGIDFAFKITPPMYKFILGCLYALVITIILFALVTNLFNYSAKDLQGLFSN